MISVVLYGRNDSYGYNLHKRAALSFNCIAELLTDPDDEILFVDYNTPDDFPTFPEAIQDTLTAKAQARLRILRVRPSVHARFKHKTHLQALEPVARNIAIRRSNPANRWILSTNTDMIFVPRDGQSLSEQVRDLPKGYYGIPRFEIPESLWETLDRRDPVATIETVGAWGWKFHLNEIVYGAPVIKFDAPGDFQLIDRADLFAMHGFDEEMLLGWHVDSNICKRLFLKYGVVGDLSDKLFGYHCDHTRQVTPMHKRTAVENSIAKFVEEVTSPDLPRQADTWGCADAAIEDFNLNNTPTGRYVDALNATIPAPMTAVSKAAYVSSTYDAVDYDPAHVLPYLADVLASAPRNWTVAWFGSNPAMLDLFRRAWPAMGFTGRILTSDQPDPARADQKGADQTGDPAASATDDAIFDQADVFIFDFAAPGGLRLGQADSNKDDEMIRRLMRGFYRAVAAEQDRGATGKLPPRRVIFINAIHNRFEPLARGHIEYARSPFSGRLRHGYVLPPEEVTPWLDQMIVKRAGERIGSQVQARQFVRGPVLSGPFQSLLPGRYNLMVHIAPTLPRTPHGLAVFALGLLFDAFVPRSARVADVDKASGRLSTKDTEKKSWKKFAAVSVEIMNGERALARHRLSTLSLLLRRQHCFRFTLGIEDALAPDPVCIRARFWTSGVVNFSIDSVQLVCIA